MWVSETYKKDFKSESKLTNIAVYYSNTCIAFAQQWHRHQGT